MTTNTSDRTLLFMMNAEQAEAFGRLLGAAEHGDGAAACQLGDMYREGLGGLRYSPKEARRWYAKSALAGDAGGQCNLGACYEHGLGCAQSYVKAVKWYRLAAAQQLGTASMNLGYCYLSGHGVPADRVEALRLFRLAVEQGEYRAEDELERLGESVSGDKVTTRPQIRLVNGTETGEHFGVVGTGGVTPLDDEDSALEKIRLELLAVLTAGDEETASPVGDGAGAENEKEYFRAYAESGMTQDDFVDEMAERYSEFLESRTFD